jgi:hypothetical protein
VIRSPAVLCLMAAALAPSGAVAAPPLVFDEVPVPRNPADRSVAHFTDGAMWNGQRIPLRFQTLGTVGDPTGTLSFGQQLGQAGEPLFGPEGEPLVCNNLDGVTLLQTEHGLWSVTHGECQPGVLQLSRLDQDAASGDLGIGRINLFP